MALNYWTGDITGELFSYKLAMQKLAITISPKVKPEVLKYMDSINHGGTGYHQQTDIPEALARKLKSCGLSHQCMMDAAVEFINQKGAGGSAKTSSSENHSDNNSLAALMLAILMTRAELLESSLRDQAKIVQDKNAMLKYANTVMAKARAAKKGSSEENKTAMPKDVVKFFADNKIPWGEGGGRINADTSHKLDAAEWDLAIQNMKGWSESLTSTSQFDIIKLQSTSGKFNQIFELMSQFLAKHFRAGDSLIRNI